MLFNLHLYTREELLAGPFTDSTARDRARAVLRIALALGDINDLELFAALKATSHDESADVRNATAYAMSYLEGEESLRLLATIAEGDPDAEVRAGAARLLATWG